MDVALDGRQEEDKSPSKFKATVWPSRTNSRMLAHAERGPKRSVRDPASGCCNARDLLELVRPRSKNPDSPFSCLRWPSQAQPLLQAPEHAKAAFPGPRKGMTSQDRHVLAAPPARASVWPLPTRRALIFRGVRRFVPPLLVPAA
eukprot:TRINITY_DN72992_c0_g1_i1.p1 TRINITY_DN72992_c0_g1~~TRINITY_DN72992_c0_g1_i1.p1  ORF type:complete len:145 (+),score=10.78 TRINITY_DN72992_c0_g1_i1:322-756(+)